jgi:hypothetical protein
MTGNTGPRRTELLVAALDAVPSIERAQLTRMLHFDNVADDQPAVFLACCLLSPGTADVIKMVPPPAE